MPHSWTRDEEIKMADLVRQGVPFNVISQKNGRTIDENEKKLKEIIYENVIAGKSIKKVSQLLNLPEDKVDIYFKWYFEYRKNKYHDDGRVDIYEKNKYHGDNRVDSDQYEDDKHRNEHRDHRNSEINKIDLEDRIEKIEMENRFIRCILENRSLHSKLNELIKRGDIKSNIKDVIANLRKK
jgi:hypothetical protein